MSIGICHAERMRKGLVVSHNNVRIISVLQYVCVFYVGENRVLPRAYAVRPYTEMMFCHSEWCEESLWLMRITVRHCSAEMREILRSFHLLRMTKAN